MFESSLLNALKSDGELAKLVSVYENSPSIFCLTAPEKVPNPYITFTVSKYGVDASIDRFNIFVDIWDYSMSSAVVTAISQRVEFLLDQKVLQHERFDTIRIFRESAGLVPETDVKEIHLNMQFSARAGRKAWMQQI
jgi:hypothetical protein